MDNQIHFVNGKNVENDVIISAYNNLLSYVTNSHQNGKILYDMHVIMSLQISLP